jgi:SAM-dependent methyltransferase
VTPAEYWRGNEKLQHITPPGERYPERSLKDLPSVCTGSVFEFGCGDGRLSGFFSPGKYVGADINPHAIEAARRNNPQHSFQLFDDWVPADTVLAFTVLLHIPDDEMQSALHGMKSYGRIVIGEIMGRQWRRQGNPPVFNRSLSEYSQMIGRKPSVVMIDYPRYSTQLTLAVFE